MCCLVHDLKLIAQNLWQEKVFADLFFLPSAQPFAII